MTATARYGLDAAPPELRLTQELLNTAPTSKSADLLADLDTARGWLAEILPSPPDLTAKGLADLRELRDTLQRLVRGEPAAFTGAIKITIDGEEAKATPTANGTAWLRAATAAECLVARATGTWPRLKLCRNPRCPVAFYDRSRNASRVWHDVATCGNAANVRAFRSRHQTFG
ncbi:CGNR zinc finger domain-containing protein [Kutzneria buriramensis]|uniref:Putative stress-induced transcription regulator n=1 Tax=Kutzneria buriramensis TaxID=1045776 RepID=A0A3E0I514_9PSEU|nr:CGNR zinc finger domain-containing protein [Kutzneria buriramensis]REH53848.1 putative stress-induced transcription regulator [Kutzneria buriramensis]